MTVQQELYKVLVLGDACTDFNIITRNLRVNPEAPALLLNALHFSSSGGMAINVAKALTELGIYVKLMIPSEEEWGSKVRFIDDLSYNQILRVDTETKVEPFSTHSLKLNGFDAVVISDYNKGFVTYDTLDWLCKYYDGPIFLDTKKKDISKYSRCFIKINEHEANLVDKVSPNTIVTLGSNGATFCSERWPAYKTKLVDVCGAGDAFLAGLVYGYLTNTDEMIEYGIVNSGISVGHVGTYTPSLKELLKGKQEYDIQCRESC